MTLVEYAEQELRSAGFFDEDSDYAGTIGPAVLEMTRKFAEEGHSGFSAHLCLSMFERLARFRPLQPIENPMVKGEFIDHTDISGGHPTYQSNRIGSVFSEDGGKTWYDIDLRVPKWKRWFGVRRCYINFPYMPN